MSFINKIISAFNNSSNEPLKSNQMNELNKKEEKSIKQNVKLYLFSLGNPGDKYKNTRHNAGRIVADSLSSSEFENLNIEYFVSDTFMNETGKFVKKILKNKNFVSNQVIIIYDDLDIPFGELKLSIGRSSGGHNGVESVINELGTRDFYRIRVGIGGKPHPQMLLQDYVLSRLNSDEVKCLESKDMQNIIKTQIQNIQNELKSKF